MMTLSLPLLINNLKKQLNFISLLNNLDNGEEDELDDDTLLAELGVEEDDPYEHVKELKANISKQTSEAVRLNKAGDKQNAMKHLKMKKELDAELLAYLEQHPGADKEKPIP